MTPEEYIKKLQQLKDLAQKAVLSKVPSIESQANQLLLDWIDATVEIKGGSFVTTPQTTEILDNFSSAYLQVLQDMKVYTGAVSSYLKNLRPIDQLVLDFQKEQNNIDLRKANITPETDFVVNEIINMYLDNGLNANFVQPMRDILYRNIGFGAGVKDAKLELKQFIAGGKDTSGKLGQYLTQTSQQGVDSYSGAINKKLMDKFDFNYLIVSGSLIKTSSPQCRYVIEELGGMLSRKDWPEVRDMAEENGLVDGTTFDNLPFNKLHWGCRHDFTPMIMTPEQAQTFEL